MTDWAETDYAWAAGFIDADGCISIRRQHRDATHSRRTMSYGAVVTASQVDPTPILRLRAMFGGNMRMGSKPRDGTGEVQTVQWAASHRAAEACIKLVRPYLVSKARQADIALDLMKSIRPRRAGSDVLSPEEIEYREALWRAIKMLNQTGVPRGVLPDEFARPKMAESPQIRLLG